MKKIIGLSIGALVLIATITAGTFAFYSNTQTSAGNTFTAGTLFLSQSQQAQVGFSSSTPSGTKAIEISSVYPGTTGSGSILLTNNGNATGTLDVKVGAIANTESSAAPPNTFLADSVNGANGEIGYDAYMAVYLDKDNSGTWTSGDIALLANGTTVAWSAPTTGSATGGGTTTVVKTGAGWTINAFAGLPVTVTGKGTALVVSNTVDTLTVATFFTSAVLNTDSFSIASGLTYALINTYGNATFDAAQTLAGSGTSTLHIDWEIPNAVTSEIQGDSCTFDISLQLRQSAAPGL